MSENLSNLEKQELIAIRELEENFNTQPNYESLKDLSFHLQSEFICNLAITLNPFNIKHVKEEFKTKDLILRAISGNEEVIKYIKNPDKELQLLAILNNPRAIKYIKNPDKDVALRVIEESPELIQYIENATNEIESG